MTGRRTIQRVVWLVILVMAVGAAEGTVIYVNSSCGNDLWTGLDPCCVGPDGPKATIQAGINASVDGDMVILAPGVYRGPGNRDIDYEGRLISVRSIEPDDPCIIAATVIDCEGSPSDPHRGFYFHSCEGPEAKIEGLTIINGDATNHPSILQEGGAIFCIETCTRPTIRNCVISNNKAPRGGGISSQRSSPAIIGCTIKNNYGDSDCGGIFYWTSRNVLIEGSTILNNSARYNQTGIYCYGIDNDMTIRNCVIADNYSTSGNSPYGITFGRGTFTIENCIITKHSIGNTGKGIAGGRDSYIKITNSIIWDNISNANLGALDITYVLNEVNWKRVMRDFF